MKKNVLLFLLLFTSAIGVYGQCFRTALYPSETVVSNNLGQPQIVTSAVFSSEYSQVSNLIIGSDYIFTCKLGTTEKYVTVTDFTNVVIAHGPSPLTVQAITSDQVRLHYSDDAACASTSSSHTVTVQAQLTCPPVTAVAVSGITTATASIAWEPTGSETAWQILVALNGTAAPTATTAGTEVTNNPIYAATALTAGSLYQVYIRPNCGTEFGPWNGPLNFATQCDPVASINENFDTYAFATLPLCWTQIKNGTGSAPNSYAYVADTNFNSASRSIRMYHNYTAEDANLILATPAVSNLSAGTHRLKFFAKSGSGTPNIKFGTIDINAAEGTFTEVAAVTINNTYTEYTIDYTQYTGTDTYIAIKHAGTSGTSIYIDDFRWEFSPLCPDVTEITIPALTATTATINWAAGGAETEWDIVYGASTVTDPTTLTPITPAATLTPEQVLTGLTENTSYNVWVRSVCGTNDGAWIGPKKFTTACTAVSTLIESFDTTGSALLPNCWSEVKSGTNPSPTAYVKLLDYNFYTGPRAAQIFNSNAGADANIMLVSPALTNASTETHRVKFYAKSSTTTGSVQVGTLDTPTASGVFFPVQTIALTTTYTEYVVNITGTNGTDPYIAFRHNLATQSSSTYIDNVVWEPIPACTDVTGITVPQTTVTSATVNWIPVGTETQWDIVYGATTVTDPSTLTPIAPAPTNSPFGTITGLTDNTYYKVWVRSVCDGGNGAWIGPVTFKTPCLALTTLDENFDATTGTDIPDCWSVIKNGTGLNQYAYAYTVGSNYNSGLRAFQLNNASSTAPSNIMLVSPNLQNVSAGTHRLKFFAKSNGDGGSIQIGTVDGTSTTAFFYEYQTIELTTTYTEYIVDFSSYQGTDPYIAFRHNTTGTYKSIYLDDIRWEALPLCTDVYDIEVNTITTTEATIAWAAANDQTTWQVAYGATTVTDPTTLTPIDVATNTYVTIPNLDNSTPYKVWVRSVCGVQNGAWIGPVNFSTACPAAAILNENFDSVSFPNLPVCWSKIIENAAAGTGISVSPYASSTPPNSVEMYGSTTTSNLSRIILVSAPVSTLSSGSYQLKFKASGNSSLEVGTLDGNTDAAVFTALEVVTPNEMTVTNYTIDFSSYSGTDTHIGIRLLTPSGNQYANIDNFVWEENLSVGSFDAAQFQYFPNPVRNILTLAYKQNIDQVTVYNLLGQRVLDNTVHATLAKIDMSTLTQGSYIVKITSENQTKTIKVIKE
ncbi:choice-of-anchor J domain-containing protein [Flavobacterium sp. SM2513]|uniref:choice-of-anchor J domain-containing protein n=1 Tax=Flavobacterium sp. SM2513 TaxID=3424766 RepID=UPI003D7F562F